MITSIYIKNFKSLKEVDLACSNLNLLTGLNGMGKSSLLQVLLLLRQSYRAGFLENDGLLLKNGNLVEIGTGKDAFYQFAGKEETIQIKIRNDNQYTFYWDFYYEADSDILPFSKKTSYNQKLSDFNLFNSNFQYLNAEHIIPQNFYKKSDFEVVQNRHLGIKGEYAVHYLSVFGLKETVEYDNLKHEKSNSDSLIHHVDAWLGEISPGTKLVVEEIKGLDLVKLAFQFETKDGYTDEFKPLNVGFGLSYVLPVIVAILTAKRGQILIIENPESHLHPKGQSSIGKLLALAAHNGIQLFVETHSDHILNGIRVAVKKSETTADKIKLFYFDRNFLTSENYTDITTPILDNDGRINNWPKGFFDEWDNSLLELL